MEGVLGPSVGRAIFITPPVPFSEASERRLCAEEGEGRACGGHAELGLIVPEEEVASKGHFQAVDRPDDNGGKEDEGSYGSVVGGAIRHGLHQAVTVVVEGNIVVLMGELAHADQPQQQAILQHLYIHGGDPVVVDGV